MGSIAVTRPWTIQKPRYASGEIPPTVTFSIVKLSLDTSLDTEEHQSQAEEAVLDQQADTNAQPLAQLLDIDDKTKIDDVNSALTSIESIVDPWTPLLANLKTFTDIVDCIAEVETFFQAVLQ